MIIIAGINNWQTFAQKISSFHQVEYVRVPQVPKPRATVPQAMEAKIVNIKNTFRINFWFLLIAEVYQK